MGGAPFPNLQNSWFCSGWRQWLEARGISSGLEICALGLGLAAQGTKIFGQLRAWVKATTNKGLLW